MKKGNFFVYIAILAVAALALFVLVYFSNSLFDGLKKTSAKDNITELKDQLSTKDLKIYWIGDCPSRLKDVNAVQVTKITEENLPLAYRYVESSRIDEDDIGNITYVDIRDRVEQDCPTYSVIVIAKAGITEEERGFIKRCMDESGTKVILLGKEAVDDYRASLYMPTGKTVNYTSMLVVSGSYKDNIFSSDVMKDVDSPEFAQEFMDYVISVFGFEKVDTETSESEH